MEKSYVIEVIEKDAPYFSMGYVKEYDGTDVSITREENNAKVFTGKEELFAAAQVLKDWHKHGKVYVMPWFYEVLSNGKFATKRTFPQDIT